MSLTPQFAPTELSFFYTMVCTHLHTHERVVLHLRCVQARCRCAPVSRQENTNTQRKNWVKRKLPSFFLFSSMHLQENKICTRWEWTTRFFHSRRLHRLRMLFKECCGRCCVALLVADTMYSSKQTTASFDSFFNWNIMKSADWVAGKIPTFCI